jgi:hydrogenase nickel incorporation protein HypA/HybF
MNDTGFSPPLQGHLGGFSVGGIKPRKVGRRSMHEYAIAYDLYSTARRAAIDNKAEQVKRICVDIGEMAMVNPEQVQFLFRILTEDDPLFAGADLECTTIQPETRCSCGYSGNERFVCPRCGSLPELVRGREIVVRHIEIEVADA